MTNIQSEKIIELSKTKIISLIMGSLGFVTLGIWFLLLSDEFIKKSLPIMSPTTVHIVGVVGILFFGFFGLVALKKVFNNSPGLVLNAAGIFDNSSAVSAGFIPWSEVESIEQYKVHSQKILAIHVKTPEKYLTGNALLVATKKANQNMSGTPIHITANTLKIGFDELLAEVNGYFAAYQPQ
jgi:hypothetical protein